MDPADMEADLRVITFIFYVQIAAIVFRTTADLRDLIAEVVIYTFRDLWIF
jgi:hypothetical protein